jgi:polyisoprenoid-binding protein YceI
MSSRAKVLIAVAVVVVALVGAGLWWYLKDDAPSEVSLEDAVSQVTTTTSGDSTATTAGEATGIEGTWTIDTESGDFDFESATGTFAGFRIDEELAGVGAATAVGRTGDVTGTFTIEGDEVTAAEFEVDLTTITTNESRRDDRVQEALETGEFPTATFTLTEPVELGEAAATGETVSVTAVGVLTIHGAVVPTEFALEARLVDEVIVVVGSTEATFTDWGITMPTAPIVLSVSDTGTIELQLFFTRR